MGLLSKSDILAAQDVAHVDVAVPEWGGSVRVKMLSGTERDAFEMMLRDRAKLGQLGENYRALLVAYAAVDEAGAFLFTLADIEALGAKSAKALDRVVEAAQALNKLTDEALDDAIKN